MSRHCQYSKSLDVVIAGVKHANGLYRHSGPKTEREGKIINKVLIRCTVIGVFCSCYVLFEGIFYCFMVCFMVCNIECEILHTYLFPDGEVMAELKRHVLSGYDIGCILENFINF